MEALNYRLDNVFDKSQKEFFISDTNPEQSMLRALMVFPVFSVPDLVPKSLFSFSGTDGESSQSNPRFKMILWLIIAGTRGGVNRAKILNLVRNTPMNANQIAKELNLDHKTIAHHVKILSKNDLIVKEQKEYGAEYQLTHIMKKNQSALEEIMRKIGTK